MRGHSFIYSTLTYSILLAATQALPFAAGTAQAQVPLNARPAIGGQVDAQHQFILDYAKQPGVEMSTNGVAYRFLRKKEPAVGQQPNPSNRIRVHYEGRLTDGTVFDSSYQRDETAVMSLEKVVKGWVEVIPRMHVGDKIEMVIPAEMGYGQKGSGDGVIPAGATLIFKVELFEVMPGELRSKGAG
ncbi:peptidylprolyl isomerase/FKBP-type peptidyl-prolyl cis-trans isomerase FkpA [Nitrospirillum amazonense]|uniref:Peptidyl-prolyl cis-trans isomerase n=1 Tax=Nitrospirillum amazonense TaxID=28077 RepID=A0A560KH61_9PROT|nr:FKBP-type peptidyl-prolyl cis-trans isomerase [Nitrospirillum amazonense]TWB82638.1 peptidylprolyl isomerase/FKBP-type peptidyl-prolyl cis-trans isomerase FkpA [Nitrospirillum amazonense]